MPAEKILLIDGHSIANRAFYGLPLLSNSEGIHTNAVLGFINILLNTYDKVKPSYIIVAFDRKEKTFRHEMFEAYKGTRKGMPEELHEQIPVLKDALHAMNIKTMEIPGFEADDILGTYARIAEENGLEAVILSGDRDLLQLATEKTMIAIPKAKSGGTETETYYAADVIEKYGVSPKEFIDVKALQGDTSDNIPGIPGIGEKTAANIIIKFKSLENAIEHIEEIKPDRARENLRQFAEQGRLSKVLATIVTDAPVDSDLSEAKAAGEASFFNEASYEIFKKLELRKIISKFNPDSFKRKGESGSIEAKFETADISKLKEIAAENDRAGLFIDSSAHVLGLAVKDANYLFADKASGKGFREEVMDFFNSGINICCFELKNILHALDVSDFRSDRVFDAGIMAYLLNPILNSYDFDSVAKDYLNILLPSKEELLGKATVLQTLENDESAKKAEAYAVNSAKTAFDSFDVLKNRLTDLKMWDLFFSMEMPLVYSLYYMEKEGICVKENVLKSLSGQLSEMMSGYEQKVFEEAGVEFNLNSPKQLGEVLFEKMGLPSGKKTKTGYSTSAQILEKLAEDYPIVNNILKYRQASKLKSTYADGLVNFIGEDGRIHGSFNQTITATGRISSTEPNLQNIPARTELGQEIRKAFVAKEGCVFLDADYSQIELRLLADMSGDSNLIESYKSDADIHKITASKVFKTPLLEVTKTQRRNAKAVNFGIVYGISSFGLSQDLSISRKEAENYIKQYFETYPDVKKFLDNTVRAAKNDGYTTTMSGRRRPIPELASGNFMQRAFGERAAMNAPIQGSAADIIKIAMINVDKALRDAGLNAKIVLQVHDELLIEAPVSEAELAKEIICREMKKAVSLKVNLEVECNEGKDWFEAH